VSSNGAEAAAIAGVVDRPRLYRILDHPLVRVCVVQGPSGSGKTTLLRSWAVRQESGQRVMWVSLSGGVASRHAFWQHVASSASRVGELDEGVATQVQERLSLSVDPVRIASSILADAGPVVLVLDAYEHLGDVMPEIDRDLTRLVAAAPDLRVMITTRGHTDLVGVDPPGGVVRVVTLGELALTVEEVGALIGAQTGIHDERLALSVVNATRGFPLTVRAVVLALSQLGRIPLVDSTEWDAIVAARLESLLPDQVAVQFVTDTSVPPYVDVELAQRLSGNEDARSLLEMLERNGFGRWIPYGRNRPVFQYVETIRDAFRARASDDPERWSMSCVTTALWLLENEEVADQSLLFAIEGGDYALADRVFVSVVISNPASYTSDRFLSALQKVPEAVLTDYPMLAFGLGLALMANPVLRAEAPRIFRIAVTSTAMPSYLEPSVDRFSLVSMRAICRRLALSWRESAEAALEAVGIADEMDPELLGPFGEHVGTVLRQLSFSLWQGGRIEEALEVAGRSVALCTRPAPRSYSMVYVAGINAFAGDTARASAVIASIDAEGWPPEMRQTLLNGLGMLAEAYGCLDAFDFAGAAEVLRDTQPYVQTTEYWPFLTAAGVAARHGLGQARAEAERVTRELSDDARLPPGAGDNTATQHLRAVLAFAWMASGDYREAARMLAEQPRESEYLAAARIALLLGAGREAEALRQADELLSLPAHTIRTLAETQTVAAVAALRQGDLERAWSWLSAGVVTWETYGARMHVALLPPRDRRLLWEFARERKAASVGRYLDVPVPAMGQGGSTAVSLSKRERVVLAALVEHDSIREIAETLVVSPHTVKSQLQSIYRKLGVSSRQSALAVAHEVGLLDTPRD